MPISNSKLLHWPRLTDGAVYTHNRTLNLAFGSGHGCGRNQYGDSRTGNGIKKDAYGHGYGPSFALMMGSDTFGYSPTNVSENGNGGQHEF